jgi:arginine exporter protein ArgO
MTDPQSNPNQYNQYNTPAKGGQVYASQGQQNIYHTNIRSGVSRKARAIALLVAVVVDIAYFFYGMAAYTGRASDWGDGYRALGFLVLLGITGNLLRRLLRSR